MMNDLGGKHPERPSKGGREKKKNNKNKAEMKRPSTSFASVVFFFLSLFSLEIFHRIPLVLRLLSLSGDEGRKKKNKPFS
jgi:hypothetical protein